VLPLPGQQYVNEPRYTQTVNVLLCCWGTGARPWPGSWLLSPVCRDSSICSYRVLLYLTYETVWPGLHAVKVQRGPLLGRMPAHALVELQGSTDDAQSSCMIPGVLFPFPGVLFPFPGVACVLVQVPRQRVVPGWRRRQGQDALLPPRERPWDAAPTEAGQEDKAQGEEKRRRGTGNGANQQKRKL